MLISVLLSIYHRESPSFFKECLESLVEQTFQANEIIIVFDGEITSELENVVKKFENKLPIKIVRLPKNVGLGKALNEGLKHCSNNWVFRMDTDDICHPQRFEKQVNFIKEHPDIVLLGGQIIEFEKEITDATNIRRVPIQNNEIQKRARIKSPFNHMTVAYQKDFILQIGGYHHHLLMEDYNLWIRVLSAGRKTANIDEILVYVRADENMYHRRRGKQYIQSEWKLFQLKRKLKFQNTFSAFTLFILRSVVRKLPISLLKKLYKFFLRNK